MRLPQVLTRRRNPLHTLVPFCLACCVLVERPSIATAQTTHVADHLVFTEVAFDALYESDGGKLSSEFFEIFNPTDNEIVLNEGAIPGVANGKGSYFFSDSARNSSPDSHDAYFNIVNGKISFGSNDLDVVFQFPVGATIPPYGTVVVCGDSRWFLNDYFGYGASLDAFRALPGAPQLFETTQDGPDDGVPDMILQATYDNPDPHPLRFTNYGDAAILFYWDGYSDRVKDVDIVVWKEESETVDKTGVSIDGPDPDSEPSTYLPDASQLTRLIGFSSTPSVSPQRMEIIEHAEVDEGGNGITGHDESSEAWNYDEEDPEPYWVQLPYTPGYQYVTLDGTMKYALSFLEPTATSPTNGLLITDYGQNGTLSELYLSLMDTDEDKVVDSLYVAVRGALFGEPDGDANASFVLIDFDPGAATGVHSLIGEDDQLEDTVGTLDDRLTHAGFNLLDTLYPDIGFDGALGIDQAVPTDDTAGWRTFGTGGTAGGYDEFAPLGDASNVHFVKTIDPIFPGAPGTTFPGNDGFESTIPLSLLPTPTPEFLFVVAVTTGDSTDSASPNTLPESSNDYFSFPQTLDNGVCFSTSRNKAVIFYEDLDDDGYGADTETTYCGPEVPGYSLETGDCDDTNPAVNPGAIEVCDDTDNDCDGLVDEDAKTIYYLDTDHDGYGQTDSQVEACTAPAQYVPLPGDCDDTSSLVHPDTEESCDGVDTDCDGVLPPDEYDIDQDGWMGCEGDCDDTRPEFYPGAEEICDGVDSDCDGNVPEDEADTDLDGVLVCQGDCDDTSATIYPGADELCDGIDTDCDGVVPATEDDTDGDGWLLCDGDCDDSNPLTYPNAEEQCDREDNDCNGAIPLEEQDADHDDFLGCSHDETPADCDDTNPLIYPNADEICDIADSDCDGVIPDSEEDADGDGVPICADDCDDSAPDVYPGASERCDGLDNDCNPATDETIDNDGDGFAVCPDDTGLSDCDDTDAEVNPTALEVCNGGIDDDCNPETDELVDKDGDGYAICDGDCDDTSPSVHPGMLETCNSIDDNCDGETDEGFVTDWDGDGYASAYCLGDDCNDEDPSIHPGARDMPEDGIDQDCDGVDAPLEDADGDGYLNDVDCDDAAPDIHPDAAEGCDAIDTDCDGVVPATEEDADGDGWKPCDGDCDDTDPDVNPDGTEVCNGIDDDCNPDTDENVYDADGDGYALCDDCDDGHPGVHPGAEEVCNGVDDDCDPATTETGDGDGDGVSICDGDCDDGSSTVFPGQIESCNGIDDNCDGRIDEGFTRDEDGDGYPNPACEGEDCDDGDATVYPGADEIPDDGIDQDCDGRDAASDSNDTPPDAVSPTSSEQDVGGCRCHAGGQDAPLPAGTLLLGTLVSIALIRRARR